MDADPDATQPVDLPAGGEDPAAEDAGPERHFRKPAALAVALLALGFLIGGGAAFSTRGDTTTTPKAPSSATTVPAPTLAPATTGSTSPVRPTTTTTALAPVPPSVVTSPSTRPVTSTTTRPVTSTTTTPTTTTTGPAAP